MDVDVLILDSSLKGRTVEHGPSPDVHTASDQRPLPAHCEGSYLCPWRDESGKIGANRVACVSEWLK